MYVDRMNNIDHKTELSPTVKTYVLRLWTNDSSFLSASIRLERSRDARGYCSTLLFTKNL